MVRLRIIPVLIVFALASQVFAQDNSESGLTTIPHINLSDNAPSAKLKQENLSASKTNTLRTPAIDAELYLKQNTDVLLQTKHIPETSSFNIVSAFNSNIHFGGFYSGYAVINFTPYMNIKPAEFISFFASSNMSLIVPIVKYREYAKTVVIKGAAVMAVESSVKLFFGSNHLLYSVIGFVLKNAALTILDHYQNRSDMLSFRNYYCAMSIRF